MIKKLSVFLMLTMVLVFSGCATKFINDTGKEVPASLGYAVQVIEASNTIYDTALSVAGDLHCQKKITDASAWKIIQASNNVYMAINTAQLAVDSWSRAIEVKGDTMAKKNSTYMQLLNLSKSVMALVKDYEAITGKKLAIPNIIIESQIIKMFGGK